MAQGFAGRAIILLWGGSAIAGVRQKAIKLNGAPIDITSDDDAGWRKLLTTVGEYTIDLDVAGVTKSQGLKSDFMAGNLTKSVSLTYPSGGVLAGSFYMQSFDDTGIYKDGTTFTAKFMSTGIVTWTPGTS